MFKKCCTRPFFVESKLSHSPVPFKYDENTERALKLLCLYAPGVDSVQSRSFACLENSSRDDAVFHFLLKRLGVDEDSDVLLLEGNSPVPDDYWEFFRGERACVSCQKLVFRVPKTSTKTISLLKTVRNCLAHGDFFVYGCKLIGFNTYQSKKTAIIRIDFMKLLEAVDDLTHFSEVESLSHEDSTNAFLVREAFARMGYGVFDSVEDATAFLNEGRDEASSVVCLYDFAISKGENIFTVNVLSFDGSKYLHKEDIDRRLNAFDSLGGGLSGCVLVTRNRLAKDTSEILSDRSDAFVFSLNETDRLLMDEDVLAQRLKG